MLSSISLLSTRVVLLGISLLFCSSLFAQDRLLPVFHFNRLTTADGLPTSEIRSPVVCDQQGFIWIGTVNGLARSDGYTCKVYRNVPDDPHSISSNSINALFVDSRGRLWIGTFDTGVSLYDAANDRFVNFLPGQSDSAWLPHNPIVVFKEDRVGNIWIGSYQSSVVLADMSEAAHETDADSMAKRIQFRRFGVGESWDSIFWIDDWDDKTLLVASGRGIFTLDRVSHQISPLVLPPVVGVRLDTVKITDFCWETPQKLWISTYAHGLYLLDRATGSLTGYHKRPKNAIGSRDDLIMDSHFDRQGRLWVGTTTGLDLFDVSSRKYLEYLTNNPNSAQDINWLSADRTGRLWVSTRSRGVYYLSPRSFRFPHYGLRGAGGVPKEIETIDSASNDSFWIGTEGNVVQLELDNLRVLRSVDLLKGERSSYGRIGAWDSFDDGKGRIWYGTWGLGLYRFETRTGRVMNFRPSKQLAGLTYKADICRSVAGVGGDSLWVAGFRDGLLQFDTRTNTFADRAEIVSPRFPMVAHVRRDRGGEIWISDEVGGLYLFDQTTGGFEHFEHDPDRPTSLSISRVRNTYQDAKGRVWVGTNVLNLWEPATRSFKHFPNSVFTDAVYAIPIGSDAGGRLWIKYPGNGLSILNPETGTFAHFGRSDGLCGNLSTMRLLKDGRAMLVGSQGMNIVHPESLFNPQPAPPLVITRMSINDSVNLSVQSLLDEEPQKLMYHQNVLEFEFAAVDPGTGHLIKYFYRLDGLEDSWVHTMERRFVRYTGLSPGEYVFRVKAASIRGYWPEQEIALAVSIAPPWWQRWWFRLMAGGAVIGLLGFIYRREVTRLRKDKLMQQEFSRRQIESQEAERKRLAAELHDGLGQDLLVVSNELQQFLQEGNGSKEDLRQTAALVQESIQSVREISSNLHPHHLNRLGFCAAVEAMTENLSRSTGLTIQRSCDDIDRLLPKETEIHVYRIIQEALSNIVRHASAKNVNVQVKRNSESIEITVTDDGKGFSVNEELERRPSRPSGEGLHGFGLSSMAERVRIVGGTMKIESAQGSGTKVHITLPYS